MNGGSGNTSGFNMRAVGVGMIWGLGMMLLSLLIQMIVSSMAPLSAPVLLTLGRVYQGLGALVGGYAAARRAASAGWLHGAISGAALVLSLSAVAGIPFSLVLLADFLKMMGIGTLLGSLGGVVGVNAAKR